MNTMDPNPEDEFELLVSGLDLDDNVDDVVDVTKLDNVALSDLFHDTIEKLKDGLAMYSDLQATFGTRESTPEERDLHSLRLACLTEMRKRGIA